MAGAPQGRETDLWESTEPWSGATREASQNPEGRSGTHWAPVSPAPKPHQGLGGMPLLGSVELASGAGSQGEGMALAAGRPPGDLRCPKGTTTETALTR